MPPTPDGAPEASSHPTLRPSHPTARPLAQLVDRVPVLRPAGELPSVTGCTHDSRAVEPGDLYAALPGARVHGADFAAQAVGRGAVAVLTDQEGAARLPAGVPVLVADDPRAVLGETASWAYGDPSRRLQVLGVTGTNGKTTIAFLLEAGLRAAGLRTGLLGTVLTRVGEVEIRSTRTTPEATDLHAMFAAMVERGTQAVAMEVSSHALALGRVDGVGFDSAVFTNLSQDHLDFHATLEDYFAAKASLFTSARSRRAVVCVDDEHGRRLAADPHVPTTTYGEAGQWRPVDVDLRADGSSFRLVGPGRVDVAASVRLPGAFNVVNAVGALACLIGAGIPAEAAVSGIAGLAGVPGRMEPIDEGQDFTALVDYAHTPDAVTTLLSTVRRLTSGRVLVVLGCGGDRDRGKRPLMGRAAVQGADVAVLTSDNPRSEDPLAILAEMAQPGALVVPDRRSAIERAVREARAGDVLVVAGKGHESGQDVAGVVTPFDDRDVLRQALKAVRAVSGTRA